MCVLNMEAGFARRRSKCRSVQRGGISLVSTNVNKFGIRFPGAPYCKIEPTVYA